MERYYELTALALFGKVVKPEVFPRFQVESKAKRLKNKPNLILFTIHSIRKCNLVDPSFISLLLLGRSTSEKW